MVWVAGWAGLRETVREWPARAGKNPVSHHDSATPSKQPVAGSNPTGGVGQMATLISSSRAGELVLDQLTPWDWFPRIPWAAWSTRGSMSKLEPPLTGFFRRAVWQH